MTATIFNSGFKEERWARMLTLSFCLHLSVFSTILFIPKTTIRYPSLEGRVYHVELVGPPSGVRSRGSGAPSGVRSGVKEGGISRTRRATRGLGGKTRRIALKRKRAVPILAKRVSSKPKATSGDTAHSPSELIDKAISKIETEVKRQDTAQPVETPSKIERTGKEGETSQQGEALGRSEGGGRPGVFSGVGTIIKLYQMEIEYAIKGNWSYPVALLDLKMGKMPESIVVLTVRSDGKILKTQFKKRSHNPLFDDSVLKAIEKSDPLPGFPDGYRKSYDEVEINFSLRDLV